MKALRRASAAASVLLAVLATGCADRDAPAPPATAATSTPVAGRAASPASGTDVHRLGKRATPASTTLPTRLAAKVPAGRTPVPTPSPTRGGGGGGEVETCVNPWLKVTPSTSQGAMGTRVQRFLVTNASRTSCSMTGTPTILPQGAAGAGVQVSPIPDTFGDLGQSGGTVVLTPGKSAAFFLTWSSVPAGDAPCPTLPGFAFRPPLDPLADADKQVAFPFEPCGVLRVSQILPASVTG